MGCSGCRKPPRIIRKPSVVGNGNITPSGGDRQQSQRDKITGLKYVPKSD